MVGAGLAGLSAALELHEHGVRAQVLEARDRVGGRVWTVRLDNGEIAELGAEWIMEGDDELKSLVGRFGLTLSPTGTDFKMREARGPGAASLDEQRDFLAAADKEVRALAEAPGELSLGDLLDSVPGSLHQRQTIRMRLQGTCGTDLSNVTLLVTQPEGAFSEGSGVYHRIGEGNQELPNLIAGQLGEVRLGSRVEAIRQDREGVTVRVGSSEIRADFAVVCIPAPLVTKIAFEPALPPVLAGTLGRLRMGVASKLAVATASAPAPRSVQAADLPFWFWVAGGIDGLPRRCVTSFAGSEISQEVLRPAEGDPGPWIRRIVSLDPDIDLDGSSALMHAWGTDPFAMGAYSSWDKSSWESMSALSEPFQRVAFAGEHTAGPEGFGTMNGAIASGRRAAAQMLSRW